MTTKKEKILQKLNPKLLKMTPKLSGDAGSFIDLDSDNSLVSGAKQLMMRFLRNQDLCEKNKRNSVRNETELTISAAKYNEKDEICELITERLSLPFGKNDEEVACERPGRRLQKLKMELQEKMSAKWEEEYKKRVSENKIYSESNHKHKKKCTKDYDIENKDEDDPYSLSQKKSLSENEENVAEELRNENLEDAEDDGDDGDIEFDEDEESNDSDLSSVAEDVEKDMNDDGISPENNIEGDDDFESCSLIPAYQPGGGMLYGGSELTQCDEELPENLLSPSLRFSIKDSSESKILQFQSMNKPTPKKSKPRSTEELENLFTSKTKLFSQDQNDSFDLSDAFEYCSGKFPEAEEETQKQKENLIKFNSVAHVNNDDEDCKFENSPLEGSNNTESKSENQISKSKKFQNIIVYEESEEEEEKIPEESNEIEESQSAPLNLLLDDDDEPSSKGEKTKVKRTRKNLKFSDEEDSSDDYKDKEEIIDEEEENEISDGEFEQEGDEQRSVHYDSEENEINPKEFFEKEAELSGSEWSGDEDERGLDEFDVEEGDADCLDNDQVRSQLEKIHIRRVLDDDAREVRLIQEILFEDGDLHSDGKRRDRKFKWKNLGAFDEKENEEGPKEDDGNDSEDDGVEEEELRQMRHEKELFLMTKKKKGDSNSDDEIIESFHPLKVTMVKTSVKVSTKGDKLEDSRSIAGISKIAKTGGFSNSRGSFLTRNEEFLSRLAKATSGITDNILGPKHSKNFVFTTKSPEKEYPERNVTCKRSIEDQETYSRREKKIKLLSSRIDTGPSILDLLF